MGQDVSKPIRPGLPALPLKPPVRSPSGRLHHVWGVVKAAGSSTPDRHNNRDPSPPPPAAAAAAPPMMTSQQLQMLVEASVAAASDTRPDEIFQRIEVLLRELLGASTVRLLYVSHWHHKLFHYTERAPDAARNPSDSEDMDSEDGWADEDGAEARAAQLSLTLLQQSAVFDVGEGIAGTVALSGQAVYIEDCAQSSAARFDQGALLCWPVLYPEAAAEGGAEGRVAMAVAEMWREEGPFAPEALALLGHAMYLAGSWLQRVLRACEHDARCRTTEALLCIGQIAPRGMDLEDLIEEVVNAVYYFTDADRVCLFMVDEEDGELWVAKSRGIDGVTVPVGHGLCGSCAASGAVINVADCYGDPRFDPLYDVATAYQTRSMLCMPVPPPEGESLAGDTPGGPSEAARAAAVAAVVAEVEEQAMRGQGPFSLFSRYGYDQQSSTAAAAAAAASSNVRASRTSKGRSSSSSSTGSSDSGGGGSSGNVAPTATTTAASSASTSISPLRHNSTVQYDPLRRWGQLRKQTSRAGDTGHSGSSSSGGGGAAAGGRPDASSSSGAQQRRRRHPIAVLQVINKRGGEVFEQADEDRLKLFCSELEGLLRTKTVEVALMKAALTERRRRMYGGSQSTRARRESSHARAQSSMLSQYGEVGTAARFLRIYDDDYHAGASAAAGAAAGADDAAAAAAAAAGDADDCSSTDSNCDAPDTPAVGAGGGGGAVRRGGYMPASHAAGSSGSSRHNTLHPAAAAAAAAAAAVPGAGRSRSPSAGPGDRKSVPWNSPPPIREEGESGGGSEAAVQESAACSGGSGGRVIVKRRRVSAGAAAAALREDLVNWEFNPFAADVAVKCGMVEAMFHRLGLSQVLRCEDETLRTFVSRVRQGYKPQPFHNFNHAFSVAHVAFMLFETAADVKRHLSPLDMLSGLLAAYCHDLDHPGNNNTFEINSGSALALLHSDDAVLERHHVHITFKILLEDGGAANIFGKLTKAEFADARKVVIRTILATDMSQHMEHCSRATRLLHRAKQLRAAAALNASTAAAAAAAANHSTAASGAAGPGSAEPFRSTAPTPLSPSAAAAAAAAAGGTSAASGTLALSLSLGVSLPSALVTRQGSGWSAPSPGARRRSHYSGNPSVGLGLLTTMQQRNSSSGSSGGAGGGREGGRSSVGSSTGTESVSVLAAAAAAVAAAADKQQQQQPQHVSPPLSPASPPSPRSGDRTSMLRAKSTRFTRSAAFPSSSGANAAEPESYLIGDSVEDRLNLLEMLVHCSDLSGQVMTTDLALEWGRRVLQEFRNQAEAEERLGLPITFVQMSDEAAMMRGQLFFLSKIVAPLWEPVAALFPEVAHLADNLDRNQAYYERELAAHAAATAAAAAADAAANAAAAGSSTDENPDGESQLPPPPDTDAPHAPDTLTANASSAASAAAAAQCLSPSGGARALKQRLRIAIED